MAGAVAKSLPPPTARPRSAASAKVLDAQDHKVMVVGIDDDPIGARKMPVGGDRDVPQGYGIVDIAADHVEIPRLYRDNNVAMARKAPGWQFVIGNRLPAAPIADQIAALRGVDLDPLGRERGSRLQPETMTPRRVDVGG